MVIDNRAQEKLQTLKKLFVELKEDKSKCDQFLQLYEELNSSYDIRESFPEERKFFNQAEDLISSRKVVQMLKDWYRCVRRELANASALKETYQEVRGWIDLPILPQERHVFNQIDRLSDSRNPEQRIPERMKVLDRVFKPSYRPNRDELEVLLSK